MNIVKTLHPHCVDTSLCCYTDKTSNTFPTNLVFTSHRYTIWRRRDGLRGIVAMDQGVINKERELCQKTGAEVEGVM